MTGPRDPGSRDGLTLVRRLDGLADRAWPAQRRTPADGWVLRADPSRSRRLNSAWPRHSGGCLSLADRIERLQAFYAGPGPARVYVSPGARPAGLDDQLDALGWYREAETFVQTAPLTAAPLQPVRSEGIAVELQRPATPTWLLTYARSEQFTGREAEAREQIVGRIREPQAAALARVEGQPAGVGLGVLLGEWLGVFGVATAGEFRRRGVAAAITRTLAQWGGRHGATAAFLQVMRDNEPALALYAGLGFRTLYGYHYRTEPPGHRRC